MQASRYIVLIVVGLLVVVGGTPVVAQSVDVGGRAYVDYFYNVSSPDADAEDLHGFTYRRLYLTADFTLSEDFTGRARLEANEGSVGAEGPMPYVKDLSLTWDYSGAHSATLGVTPPPAFEISEGVWGYRSLEKTILDLQGVVSSRDFGLRLDGPLAAGGTVRYAVMYANNSGIRPETNPHKRVYGRLSATPTERLVLVAGGDYAEYDDQRDRGIRLSGFAGYRGDEIQGGMEVFRSSLTRQNATDTENVGVSLFGRVQLNPEWELVGRFDWTKDLAPDPAPVETLWLGGVAYRPHPNVALIPNLRVRDGDRLAAADTKARFTVEISF